MSDFVNWEYLESELEKVKTAAVERMDPLDQVDLSKMIDNTQQEAQNPDSEEKGTEIGVGGGTEETGGPVIKMKIKNMKGRIKQVDPNDFEVTIQSDDGKTILTSNLSRISSGVYSQILVEHGKDKALECLLKDAANNPEIIRQTQSNQLTFVQAKMVLTSIDKTSGISTKTAQDILNRTRFEDRKHVEKWLHRRI